MVLQLLDIFEDICPPPWVNVTECAKMQQYHVVYRHQCMIIIITRRSQHSQECKAAPALFL